MKKILQLVLVSCLSGAAAYGQYCTGGPTSSGDSNIDGVSLIGESSSISFTGTCPGIMGLEDQTASVVVLDTDGTYTIDVDWGTCGGNYGNSGEVWIDYDGNQVFDPTESIGTFDGTPLATSNFTFTVPAGATIGTTRMRVMQQETGVAPPLDPCATYTWGGKVDFTVEIVNITCPQPTGLMATTVNINDIDLAWTIGGAEGEWTVEYGAPGFTPGTGVGTSSTVTLGTNTNISGLAQATTYDFYVRAVCGVGDSSFWEGPLTISTNSSCPQPTAFAVNSNNGSNIIFDWVAGGSELEWQIDYGAPGYTAGTGTTLTTSNNPETISGLVPQTNYHFYLRGICAPGDTSVWVGPLAVTPACIYSSPYFDGLENHTVTASYSGDECWMETSSGTFTWDTRSGTTTSSSTGPDGAYEGSNYIYTEASSGSTGNVATFESGSIDLTGNSFPVLRFFSHMYGATIDVLNVEVFDGTTWNTELSIVGQQQNASSDPWEEQLVDLTAYSGLIQVRFSVTRGTSFTGDVSIDAIEIFDGGTICFAPQDFEVTGGSFTSVDFGWSAFGAVGNYVIEYGAPGFTPGTFTNVENVNGATTATINGLTANTLYEAYIFADCGADSSTMVGPVTFNTFNQGVYIESDNACGPGFNDISLTGTQDLLATNGEVGKTLPWVFLFNGVPSDEITIGNHGDIYFGTLTGVSTGTNVSIASGGPTGFFPFWDYAYGAYESTDGVFTQTVGTAPNRQYIIQYNVPAGFNGEPFIYQVVLDEATSEIFFIYEDVEDGISDDNGNGATIGVVSPNQGVEVSFNDTEYLENNTCARFYYTNCPKVTDLTSLVYDTDTIIVSWNPGLAGETDWTIEYGPAGFTPGTGTTFSTTNTQDTIAGLNYLTDYDVYVYADCNVGLQSLGSMITIQTAPICSTPTGLTATSMQDSIGANWSWTPLTVPSTGFNIQYGLSGAGQYGNNTTVAVDNDFSDTIVDNTLLGGTLYDVYVQAVCGADTSLYAGPFTIITPLTNDTTCSAIGLNVDGTVYNFNNSGATVGAGETNIAPPNTGSNEIDGWTNSTLNNTTWFTFVAPASGRVYITGQDQGFAGQMAVYSVTDCGDYNTFTLEGANDNAINGGGSAPGWVQCGLTAGNTYYLMHDGNSGTTGNYSIRLEDVDLNAGSFDTPLEACSGDTVDLFTAISGQDAGGVWIDYANTFQLTGSNFATTVLATGVVYDFEYRVTRECAYDSVIATVEIYGPSQAGDDGTMTVCQNQPTNLFSALNGTADVGGTWYDPSDNALPNATPNASSIPGQFNYDYIVGNGVCPDDTALVVITVDPSCDYLGLEDAQLEGISIFPNPTSDILTVASNGSHEALNVEVVDINGRVVYTSNESVLVGSTLNIDVTSFETGVYILRLFNNEVENTYRVVVK